MRSIHRSLGAVQCDVSGGCGYWCYIVKHRECPPLENLIVPELGAGGDFSQDYLSLEECFLKQGVFTHWWAVKSI